MTYREFLSTVDEKLNSMTEKDKTNWIHELARKQKEYQWNDFLLSFTVTAEAEAVLTEQIERINDFLHKVEEGELCFHSEEEEYYEDDHWERDFRTVYLDPEGIGKQLLAAFELAENLVVYKQYHYAAELYERLCEVSVGVVGDYGEYDPLDLIDMIREGLLSLNMKSAALNLLYSQYQCLSGTERIEKFVSYFNWRMFDGIKISEVFTAGPEELKNADLFLEEWVAALAEVQSNRAGELLTEACLELGGATRLHKEAARLHERHPMLYENLCIQYRNNGRLEDCENAGVEALKVIPQRLTIRSRIADILFYAANERGSIDIQHQAVQEAFFSRSSLCNFLRLYELPDKKTITEKAARYAEALPDSDSRFAQRNRVHSYMMNRTRKYDQWEENVIAHQNKTIIYFFNLEFKRVIEVCTEGKGFLGWSDDDLRGVVVPLFLLALNKDTKLTKAGAALVGDIKHKLDFEESENRTFVESFLKWKEMLILPDEQFESINQWLKEMIMKRTDAVVGGNYRNSYHKAAKLIVAYGEMLETNGQIGAKAHEIAHYKKLHSRKSAFRGELDKLS